MVVVLEVITIILKIIVVIAVIFGFMALLPNTIIHTEIAYRIAKWQLKTMFRMGHKVNIIDRIVLNDIIY